MRPELFSAFDQLNPRPPTRRGAHCDGKRESTLQRASRPTVEAIESRVLLSASLIKDINPGTAGSNLQNSITIGNEIYFAANDGIHGQELWKSDGTAGGTVMVDDINPGAGSSNPADLTVVGSVVYFAANDGVHGTELWVTDGTAAGTKMVADINPGAASSNPANLTAGTYYRGLPLLYFTAAGPDGTPQVYDAIPGNTPAVTEITRGLGLTTISDLAATNGYVFFSANDGVHGTELWSASNYGAPTLMDINPGPGSSTPTDLTALYNAVYFSADDGIHGRELWEASGPSYFSMVKDIDPGAASSNPTGLYASNYSLYFSANGQFWMTRGDETTTIQITVGPQFSHVTFTPLSYALMGNTLFIANYDSYTDQTELWQTDGTAAGTIQTAPGLHLDYSTPQLYATESAVYFVGAGLRSPEQLYQTTGNGTGASLADPSEQTGGWSPNLILGLANRTLLFSATDTAHGSELWGIQIPSIAAATFLKTDTTTQGTFLQTYGYDFITPNEDNLPPSVQFATENASTYDWAQVGPGTYDPRALQTDYPMSSNPFRDAPCYYSPTQFSLDLNLTDGLTHQVALYLLDYDNLGRSESVQVSDAITGQILSTQSVSNFQNGKWLVYNLTGDVKITVINQGPMNAVVSALAVDRQFNPPLAGKASFVTTNTTLGGNWVGTYGSGGYDVLGGDAKDIPASITETDGATQWEWAYKTSDPRALIIGPGSTTKLADCVYSATTFNVDLSFNDGQSHQLALYLLDYDYWGRIENVQLSDPNTGAVLDSRTVSNFQSGEYLVYNVSGDVRITFTNVGPENAVLSGLFIDPPNSSPSFVKTDVSTQGNFTGLYGTDGYFEFAGSDGLNPYGTVAFGPGAASHVWSTASTDARVLVSDPGATARFAGCEYSENPSFSFNLQLAGNQTYQVALYFLDYDSQNRSETVQVSSGTSGAVLDTELVSNFSQGKYLVWDLSGDVNFTITKVGGLNEVVSAVFIDPAAPPTASFVTTDSTTQGTFTGHYGQGGFVVFGGGSFYPKYAEILINQPTHTWNSNATDTSALQFNDGSPYRVAACDYSVNPSFTFNVSVTDGLTHQVALYFLDYDSQHRAETIEISDPRTGKVLDTEYVSDFTAGKYLVWNLSGDVNITVINSGGLNEVLSGIFFN